MASLVIQETDRDAHKFIAGLEHKTRRADSEVLASLMQQVTGHVPRIWGDNFIIGFGKYTYRRKGQKEDLHWFHVGFAPRKSKMTVYLTFDINEVPQLTDQLGKCKWGKGCLHFNKLADIDLDVLKGLVERSKDARWH